MTDIVEAPITVSPEQLVELAIERMQATYPNFKPNPADPEYRMFVAFANICSETLLLGFDVPEAIIRFVGAVVYQIAPVAATFATGKVKFIATDTLGHEVPVGTQLIITAEGGNPLGYEVAKALVIPAGQSEGEAEIRAIESGTESNILGAAEMELSEPLRWVKETKLELKPSGGSAEESTAEYTKRILELARLVAPRPILPEDFAAFVRLLTTKEKIPRCLAIDGMELEEEGGHTKVNGAGEGTVKLENQERCVTVIASNSVGKAISTAAREEAEAKLKESRESTFKTYVAGPTITTVAVEVVGKTLKGFTPTAVKEKLEAALKEYLNPASWGVPKSGDTSRWLLKKTLRRQAIINILEGVEGFNFYTTLKIKGTEAEEYALPGIAPLTEAGVLTITLTEGSEAV